MKRLFFAVATLAVAATQADLALAKGPGNGGAGKSGVGTQFKAPVQVKSPTVQLSKGIGNVPFKGNQVKSLGQPYKTQHHLHIGLRHFHADWCYPRSYANWRHCCWHASYGCYCYYCPTACCWYYWYQPQACYLPVSYLTTYAPTPMVQVNNSNANSGSNTNVDTDGDAGEAPPLPQGAVAMPQGAMPLPTGIGPPGTLPKS